MRITYTIFAIDVDNKSIEMCDGGLKLSAETNSDFRNQIENYVSEKFPKFDHIILSFINSNAVTNLQLFEYENGHWY